MIKTLFSSQSEMKLKEHTKALFVDNALKKLYNCKVIYTHCTYAHIRY